MTTPIDETSAQVRLPAEIARLLAVDQPVLILDPARHEVVASNVAAERRLGFPAQRPLPLDPAMPGWQALRGGLRAAALDKNRHDVVLLLWTPAGPSSVAAEVTPFEHDGRQLAQVTLVTPGSTASEPAAARTTADDKATLREIARRIREGTAALAERSRMTTAQSAVAMAAGPPVKPPPLDFRQANPPPSESPGAAVPVDDAARPRAGALARLAHELRTPLSAIVSLSEVMRDERLGPMTNPKYKAYAADIYDSAQHTLDLVAHMIADAAPGEAAAEPPLPRLDRRPLDLATLAASSGSAMQPIADRGSVTLAVEPAADLPMLDADRRAVRQIILNLLSNALRHTPRGGRITLATLQCDDGRIALSVTDTGTGMREAEIARALARPDITAMTQRLRIAGEKAGLGIGLPLVRELIEAHGGTLTIDSMAGKGTRVTTLFPASAKL